MAATKFPCTSSRGSSCPSTPNLPVEMRNCKSIDRFTSGSEAWKLRVDGKSGESLRTNFMVTKYSFPARLTAAPKEKSPKVVRKSLQNRKIESFLRRFSSGPQDSQPAKEVRRGVIGWKLSMTRPTTLRRHPSKAPSPCQPPREGAREDRELYLQYLQFKHRRVQSSV